MSKTTDKINKIAIQHKVIGAKTDCPHFNTIGNLCSRVQNGMMRCDEYLECEFKYIDALKEENEQLQKRFNDYQDRKIEENANLMKKLDIADKKLTVFSRELEQANKENEKLKQQLEIDKNQINYFIEENEKLKKTIEKIKALNLFSLNNSREKITEINAIINDQKESEEQ